MFERRNEELSKPGFPCSIPVFHKDFSPRICSHHFLLLCGLPMPCWEHPGPPQSRAAGKSGANGIMEYPGLGGTTRIMEWSSWPCTAPPKIPPCASLRAFSLSTWGFYGNSWFLPTPQPPSGLFFSFPLGSHSSKWTGDGFNNTEWFLFMQKPATRPLPASLTDSLCSLSYFLGQQFQH